MSKTDSAEVLRQALLSAGDGRTVLTDAEVGIALRIRAREVRQRLKGCELQLGGPHRYLLEQVVEAVLSAAPAPAVAPGERAVA